MRRIACCLALAAAMAPAAEPMDEVLVTARRMTEQAHAVPLAVDVVQSGDLGAGAVDGMQALATALPGLNFESFWGGSGASPVLRAQAQPSASGDNVGVFVDDIYQASRSAMDRDLLDIERIEVLRGPQNTQFGRSTLAGAIRYVSRRPDGDAHGSLQLDAGSDGLFGMQGMLTGPLGSSGWLGRVAYGHRQAGGTVDVQGATDAGAMRSDSLRITSLPQPGVSTPLSRRSQRTSARRRAFTGSGSLKRPPKRVRTSRSSRSFNFRKTDFFP